MVTSVAGRYLSGVGKLLIGLGLAGGIVYSVSTESSEDSELRDIMGKAYTKKAEN